MAVGLHRGIAASLQSATELGKVDRVLLLQAQAQSLLAQSDVVKAKGSAVSIPGCQLRLDVGHLVVDLHRSFDCSVATAKAGNRDQNE